MFIKYLVISIIVLAVVFGLTYLYRKNYIKQVNLRLKNNKQTRLVNPTIFFILFIIGLVVVTIIINIFPVLTIEYTVVNEENESNYTLYQNRYEDFLVNPSSILDNIEDYDIDYNDDGMYIIAFGDDYNSGGLVNEALDYPFNIYSKVMLFDQNNNIVWDTKDFSDEYYKIIYDNHEIDARAVEFLDDGNIAIFGLSIDLDTNIVYQTVLILDIRGDLIELIDLDISDYGFTQWGGHYYHDIVSNGNGFTVEYDTTFRGSLMIHFNEEYDYEWHVINDEGLEGGISYGRAEEEYLETLVYKNNAYYILNDETIRKYDDLGTLIWEKTFNFDITGFDVFDDEIIILSGSYEDNVVRNSLLELNEEMYKIYYIDVISLDINSGEINDSYSYQYDKIVKGYETISVFGHYTIKDDLGNYYVLAHDIPHYYTDYTKSFEQVYLIMKFDSSFKYMGFSTISIDGIYSRDLEDLLFKTSNYIKGDNLYLNGVLVENRVVVHLDELSFSEEGLNLNVDFYNALITVRVYMVNIMVLILVECLFIVFPIYYHFVKQNEDEYIDEDVLREKYHQLYK